MKILSPVKHYYRKFKLKVFKKTTQVDVVQYKTLAWQSATAGAHYAKVVNIEMFRELISPVFLRNLPGTKKILEVGAGTGRLTRELLQAGHHVTATDVSKSMLDQIEDSANLEKAVVDAHKLPYEDSKYDAVVSLEFLSHFPTWQRLLEEQFRVLKPGGVLIFSYLTKENALLSGEKLAGNSSIPIATSENSALISTSELEEICAEFECNVASINPYGIFWGNDLFSGFMNRKQARAISLEFLDRFDNNKMFRDRVVELEKVFSDISDSTISSRAIAVIHKDT